MRSPCRRFSTEGWDLPQLHMSSQQTMNAHEVESVSTLDTVRQVDAWAREYALAPDPRVRIESLRLR